MKTLVTFIFILNFWQHLQAQDKIYVHVATSSTIDGTRTIIDHPDLNFNPNAKIVFCHAGFKNGSSVIPNPNPTGLWYQSSIGRWVIYNENAIPMIVNSAYNIYIADTSDVFTHVATAANTAGTTTAIPTTVASENSFMFHCNYFNPNAVQNTNFSGSYFAAGLRRIFNQNIANSISIGSAYRILTPSTASLNQITLFTHTTSASNTNFTATTLNHSAINNNPNATFLIHHYWGIGGTEYQAYTNSQKDVFYDDSIGRWQIYNIGTSLSMPLNVVFDIVVAPQDILSLSVAQNAINQQDFLIYPNPANDVITIQNTSNASIDLLSIYDISGKKILEENQNFSSFNIQNLDAGIYFLQITADGKTSRNKFIKQ